MFLSTVRRWYNSWRVQVREQARENRVGHGLEVEKGTRKSKWSWIRIWRRQQQGREDQTREQSPQSPLPTTSPVISPSPSIPEPPISDPPVSSPPTTKRVQRLERELSSGRLPIVRYLPAPEIINGFNQDATAEWLARWVHSDIPSVCIEHQNACCHICLMDFEEPQLKLTLGDQASFDNSEVPVAESLRQLTCRHVFHQLCIDSYLFGDDSKRFRCPVCHERIIPLSSNFERWKVEFQELISTHRENVERDYGDIEQDHEQDDDGDEDEDIEVEDNDNDDDENEDNDNDEDEDNEDEVEDQEAADGSPQFDEDGLLVCEYTFAPNNKYLNLTSSNHSLLRDAKTLLEQNGNLSEAALILEAAIQTGDLGDGGYEAWILLGETRRLDARSEMGMHALVQGVRHAQAAGAMGPGMLSLAIAYMYHSHRKAFHIMLLHWLQARFPDSPIPKKLLSSAATADSSSSAHNDVVNAFLSLMYAQHSEGIEDLDMRIALGELYRTDAKYKRARSCFGSALAADPQNYLFWNKLGCTFPEGDDAIAAFQETVRLRPTYTQAFVNLASTYHNLGIYREAAESFLTAISLQQAAGGKSTEVIWIALRDTFRPMGRPDLVDISTDEDQTNLEVYRKEGFHF